MCKKCETLENSSVMIVLNDFMKIKELVKSTKNSQQISKNYQLPEF